MGKVPALAEEWFYYDYLPYIFGKPFGVMKLWPFWGTVETLRPMYSPKIWKQKLTFPTAFQWQNPQRITQFLNLNYTALPLLFTFSLPYMRTELSDATRPQWLHKKSRCHPSLRLRAKNYAGLTMNSLDFKSRNKLFQTSRLQYLLKYVCFEFCECCCC